MSDQRTVNIVLLVLLILVAFMVAIVFLAQFLTGQRELSEEPEAVAMVDDRIRPVGVVTLVGEEEDLSAKEADVQAPAVVEISGEEVYNTACVICHGTGIAGAPKFGDVTAWVERIAQGNDLLYEHAIQGYQTPAGVMPAKGGNLSLSDEAVTAAVDYMVTNSQ